MGVAFGAEGFQSSAYTLNRRRKKLPELALVLSVAPAVVFDVAAPSVEGFPGTDWPQAPTDKNQTITAAALHCAREKGLLEKLKWVVPSE